MDFISFPVECEYICAGEGYSKLVNALDNCVLYDGDIVVISETPISTIEGSIVSEGSYHYGLISFIITEIWCKLLWGYIIGSIFFDERTTPNLRHLPYEARNHKEFILREYGLKHALMPSGEAGVDLSNVPGNYVSLLPANPEGSAFFIKQLLLDELGVCVDVMIIDTDPTYKFLGKYFTSIPHSVKGIVNDTGIFGYILRFISRKVGATPLATTFDKNVDELIELANIAEECQYKALDDFFETIYNMTDRFDVEINDISTDMLRQIKHVPAIIIRRKYL